MTIRRITAIVFMLDKIKHLTIKCRDKRLKIDLIMIHIKKKKRRRCEVESRHHKVNKSVKSTV